MNVLKAIIEHKASEVAERRRRRPLRDLKADIDRAARRDFAAALKAKTAQVGNLCDTDTGWKPVPQEIKADVSPTPRVIAEIKRRSPSKGALREGLDAARLAEAYAEHGAAALSVLTDERFFGARADDLANARRASGLPVLRKDFTIDEYQILEAAAMGADAVLLIARVLETSQMAEYILIAAEERLAAVVEVHDERELDRALEARAGIIGVNNRDLDTFEVSLETCLRLRTRMPGDVLTVAESAIHARRDVERVAAAGFHAVLVGESLVRAADPGRKLDELLGRTS